jgi:protein TonB
MIAEVAVMLQVAMVNPGTRTIPTTRYGLVAIVLGVVIVAHLMLLLVAQTARDRTVERIVEPRTITAMLLGPEPEPARPVVPAAPAAVVPPKPPTPPAARAKPSPQPQPRPRVTRSAAAPAPTPQPAPAPLAPPQSAAPSASTQPTPAIPSPAAPTTTPAQANPPAIPASTAPKNVSHVDCAIPKPDYPDMSRRRGENGTAVVRFVVGLTGRIDTMHLQKSSGYPQLDEAALAATRASVCQPYSENGVPVRAAYSQSFVFGMSD